MTKRTVIWIVGLVIAALLVLMVTLVLFNNVSTVTGH
jgi:beta-lactamase regulating signal transducer with metallopeptidase domain